MYKLNPESTYANKLGTGEWHNVETSPEYLAWLAAGNTPEPADPPPTPDVEAMRLQAYRDESDPLFFKWQAGEIDKSVWEEKRAEIKARWV